MFVRLNILSVLGFFEKSGQLVPLSEHFTFLPLSVSTIEIVLYIWIWMLDAASISLDGRASSITPYPNRISDLDESAKLFMNLVNTASDHHKCQWEFFKLISFFQIDILSSVKHYSRNDS